MAKTAKDSDPERRRIPRFVIYGVPFILAMIAVVTYFGWPEYPDEDLLNEIQRTAVAPQSETAEPGEFDTFRVNLERWTTKPHDPRLVAITKKLPGIRWNNEMKMYIPPEPQRICVLSIDLETGDVFLAYRPTKLQRFQAWLNRLFHRNAS